MGTDKNSLMPLKKVRLDKWLWAARFFKTRAKARQAIDGGKVQWGGIKAKPSKELHRGDIIRIRQGYDQKTVAVTGLSEQRRGATEAALLYEETRESIDARERAAEQRKMANNLVLSDGRPTKKDRRLIHKFRDKIFSTDN